MLAKFLSMLSRPTKGDIYYKHSKRRKLPHHIQAQQATLGQASNLRNHATTHPLRFLCRLIPVTCSDHPATPTLRVYETRGKVVRWRSPLPRLGRSHRMLRRVTSHPTSSNLYPIICHLLLLKATRSRRETHMRKVYVEFYPKLLSYSIPFHVSDEESRNILRSPQSVKTEEASDFLSSFLPVKKEEEIYIKPEGIYYANNFVITFLILTCVIHRRGQLPAFS